MIRTTLPLSLTREQASRLHTYLQAYRRHAFASLPVSLERNNTLRLLQGMQGKLIAVMDQRATPLLLTVTTGEMTTLKTITTQLLLLHAREPASPERSAILADLAALKATLERYH